MRERVLSGGTTIGGKARNLLELEKLGFKVPQWVVLPSELFENQLPDSLTPALAQQAVQNLHVPPQLLREIAQAFGPDHASKFYAVRSSALDEDGVEHSFAGLFTTHLQVPFEHLAQSIVQVWQSSTNKEVLAYRKERNLAYQFGLGVIVQEMLVPEVSGVGFGADPLTGDEHSKVVTSVFGLGEGLVSGALNADTFTITPSGISSNIARKTHALQARAQGTEQQTVPPEKMLSPSLTTKQLQDICSILEQLHAYFGQPQDLEFAVAGGEVYTLQTRPITAVNTKIQEEQILWDNSNIIESYPGVTTPLTYTFISKMYEWVYKQFVILLGVDSKVIERHQPVFANTLGLVRGRVYYNLLSWYKMLAMLPGYSINARFMENMMGVDERFELKEDFGMGKGRAWYKIVHMIVRMLYLHWTLGKERSAFLNHLEQTLRHYKAIPFDTLQPEELVAHYLRFENSLLLEWKAPLINDFFAMIWFGMLQKFCAKHAPDHPNLHNDLLCGSADIISVQPIHQSMAIAQLVLAEPKIADDFLNHTPETLWANIEAGNYPPIQKAVRNYIAQFGERCVGELKLETISYTQDPVRFIKVIQSYVKQGITTTSHNSIEESLRSHAEEKMKIALKRNLLLRWWFGILVRMTRELVSNRENLRFERTRGFGLVREMFVALGKQLYLQGKLDNARDIFYLELSELVNLQWNKQPDLMKESIATRKKEFATYHEQEPPSRRFFTQGYHFTDAYIYSKDKLPAAIQELKGIGCCPGKVRARVQVVNHPEEVESLHGDILVTSSTDPGWVTLFPSAGGILVERGSLLSHSAIVSREMGIPCIVAIPNLMASLKTGDRVLMDGGSGEISILAQ